jgi:hypothetical protein
VAALRTHVDSLARLLPPDTTARVPVLTADSAAKALPPAAPVTPPVVPAPAARNPTRP